MRNTTTPHPFTRALTRRQWIVGGLSALSMSVACAQAWQPLEQGEGREGIRTWSRSVPGQAVNQFRGETEVPYSVLSVLALLSDVPNMKHWVFQCSTSSSPEGLPADRMYLQFKGIWPASPRDVLLRTRVSQTPDGIVHVRSEAVDGLPPDPDRVRMPMLSNTFTLTPMPGEWTRIEFQTQVDLGGHVPTWLANLVSTRAPLLTLQGIRAQLPKPAYQKRTLKDMAMHLFDGPAPFVPAGHLKTSTP